MPQFTLRGTRPATLGSVYADDLKDVWNPDEAILALMARPFFEPVAAGRAASVAFDGEEVSPEEVAALIGRCLGENYNTDAEMAVLDLFRKGLATFASSARTRVDQAYVCQAAGAMRLPAADDNIIYSASADVIPAARELLAKTGEPERLMVGIAYAYEPSSLGVWVRDATAWNGFLAFLQMEAVRLSADLQMETRQAVQGFAQTRLAGLVTTLLVRNQADPAPQNEPGSLARFLVGSLMTYSIQNPDEMGIMPFSASELVCPTAIAIADVDAHAHATASDVNVAWRDSVQSLRTRPTILSQAQVANLSAATAALRRAQRKAERADAAANRDAEAQLRNELAHMRTTPPKAVDLVRAVSAKMRRMGFVQRSENFAKTEKKTYMRPNRRHPEDVTLAGRHVSVKYYPDIHIYVDTSGSISEKHYASSVLAIIRLAKRLNVDVIVTFFSHVMTTDIRLKVKDRSPKSVYAAFKRLKKVTGGTDYLQIWEHIQSSPARRRELSLVITDFEWALPSRGGLVHPDNVCYYPVAAESDWNWKCIVDAAKDFARSMIHLDPKIRSKILF